MTIRSERDAQITKHAEVSTPVIIAPMVEDDWPGVAEIYREGIATGHATFTAEPPDSWEAWYRGKLNACCLVARIAGDLAGWAALSPTSTRAVYAGVAEASIYVAGRYRGKGVGTRLFRALISQSEAAGIWTLQAGIFPENEASLALHIKHGFRKVGRRERLALMTFGPYAGRWRDVLLLERRSSVVALDNLHMPQP